MADGKLTWLNNTTIMIRNWYLKTKKTRKTQKTTPFNYTVYATRSWQEILMSGEVQKRYYMASPEISVSNI